MTTYSFHIRVGNDVIPYEGGSDLADLEAVKGQSSLKRAKFP